MVKSVLKRKKSSSKKNKLSEYLTKEDSAAIQDILSRSKVELEQIQEEEDDDKQDDKTRKNTGHNSKSADPYTAEECQQLASGYALMAEVRKMM
jgi:hypothetical protein